MCCDSHCWWGCSRLRIVVTSLHDAIIQVANNASTSSSSSANTCLVAYAPQISSGAASVARFAPCLQLGVGSFAPIKQFTGEQYKAAQFTASAPSLELNQCTVTDGNCSIFIFSEFEDVSSRLKSRLQLATTGITVGVYDIQSRIMSCLAAVTRDVLDAALTVRNKFDSCLSTGRIT
ncbi:uncharacterized protein LOC131436890 isoform X2 [Malaya genurostris]|uniref:uncharacterized protein LOC131436890 isoform X2 n=1 Tax=Malaya genurostris TaxID=325434 RepID=UPI0026F3D885|nr:uncharacterized protein LOC131436890 isoform X2 [Malaya genurostris]